MRIYGYYCAVLSRYILSIVSRHTKSKNYFKLERIRCSNINEHLFWLLVSAAATNVSGKRIKNKFLVYKLNCIW